MQRRLILLAVETFPLDDQAAYDLATRLSEYLADAPDPNDQIDAVYSYACRTLHYNVRTKT